LLPDETAVKKNQRTLKKIIMKKMFLMLLAASASQFAMAQTKENAEPYMTKSLSGQSISRVEAETSGGNVSVESVAAEQARIEVFASPSHRNTNAASREEIKKILDEHYDLKVDVAGNTLKAVAKSKNRKWDRKNSLSISFRIYTAANVSTMLTTSGGNITLRGLTGDQTITTSGGNLNIDKVKGKLKGTTSGGNILVKDSDQEISLTTSGGNIDANNCNGDIKLITSGGSIMLVNLKGNTEAITSGGNVEANTVSGELEANTSGGNIDLKGISGNLATATSGGQVHVEIKEPGKFVKIRNSGGDISLQLPANKGYDLALSAKKIQTTNLGKFTGKTTEEEVNGQLNGGGSAINVDGGNGKITLTIH
jgi:hypothetical protein